MGLPSGPRPSPSPTRSPPAWGPFEDRGSWSWAPARGFRASWPRRSGARGGRVLLSDPFRGASLRLLEALEADGWGIALTKWDVGEGTAPRPIGVFELEPPRSGVGAP